MPQLIIFIWDFLRSLGYAFVCLWMMTGYLCLWILIEITTSRSRIMIAIYLHKRDGNKITGEIRHNTPSDVIVIRDMWCCYYYYNFGECVITTITIYIIIQIWKKVFGRHRKNPQYTTISYNKVFSNWNILSTTTLLIPSTQVNK